MAGRIPAATNAGLRAHSTITSHLERRCIPYGRIAKIGIPDILVVYTSPTERFNAQNCEPIVS
jgi:hypothetical protein